MSRHPAPDPIDLDVGLRIYNRRIELGLSQAQLGAALGVTFQQVQKYERGHNRVSASTLVRAAKLLEVQPGALLPESDAPALPLATKLIVRLRGASDLLETYAAIGSPKRRRIVLALARALAEEEVAESSQET